MEAIANNDIRIRIVRDNPWWNDSTYHIPEAGHPKRVYFKPFMDLALNTDIKRAAILLGPRRVGKTFMLKQLIHEAINVGYEADCIMYVSIDTPIYSGIGLEDFIKKLPKNDLSKKYLIIFDEIQYLKDWEVHLKDLVDSYPHVKFIASGSAAAALRLKSRESGAGRFSDFMLPPLTFFEFLKFLGEDDSLIKKDEYKDEEGRIRTKYQANDIDRLNSYFVEYLNYGGYPEAVLNAEIRSNPERFIKSDIIDKVLLKDLPSLYGINGIQELNQLFSFLAYNAGLEANYENIAKKSGISKPTITRYIEYLESAFLIIKVSSIDDTCKVKQRDRNFKIYLNNPSMRAALFAPVSKGNTQLIGRLTECAIYSQWQHATSFNRLYYSRWKKGEIDIVYLPASKQPAWIGEVKWSDRMASQWKEETAGLSHLIKRHKSINSAILTSKTIHSNSMFEGVKLDIYPSALYAYLVGRNITTSLGINQTF